MVEVFITNVKEPKQAEETLKVLEHTLPKFKINFDLEDFEKPYPCGHSILRIEGSSINNKKIIQIIQNEGFKCEILEDKLYNC
ncbi:hypothetical protein SAMN06265377_2239 [Flagellimonas pacifica]|uniref:Uncharacterized protein n=1 Tax=Flagellimonas pacifica TaxID=1247520 RepID=A0A285MTA1_9FLAO|nr:hypothetical protein SAMN06265377_2239 [Allomuricauda parva]